MAILTPSVFDEYLSRPTVVAEVKGMKNNRSGL